MSRFQLTEEQRQAVENRGGALLVSAAAGSGKTRVLVERLFHYVEKERCQVDDFLIITYTKAAAAELRGRIAQELSRRLADRPDDTHLRRQVTRVYQADIKTVDAFCASLLRQNVHLLPAVEGRSLTADLRVLDEQEALLLRRSVLQRVLDAFYEELEQGDNNALLLAQTLGAGRDDRALEELVLDVYGKLQSHPRPLMWLRAQRESWETLPPELSQSPYGQIIMAQTVRRGDFWARRLRQAAEQMKPCPALYNAYADRFLEVAEQLESYGTAARQGWDAMALIQPTFRRMGTLRGEEYAAEKAQAQALLSQCKRDIKRMSAIYQIPSQAYLEDMQTMSGAMLALMELTERFARAYQTEKVRRNCIDFSDQEHYAIDILTLPDGSPTDLAVQLSGRYREVMVDEYQDTNAVQNCIFSAISARERQLFAVGDVKQSIYRFRLADPTIFLEKYGSYCDASQAREGEGRRVLLQQNFRSRPQVLQAINFIFRQIMSEQMGEMAYGPAEQLCPGAAYPSCDSPEAEFHLISVEDTPQQRFDRQEVEARFVAHRIRTMLDEGYLVQGEDGAMRPVRPEDIVILMRSPRSRMKTFTAALMREGIPCSGGENEAFFASMEIAVMVSFLEIVDNPHQDVPLISVLRSPLFGFTPDRLAQIRMLCPAGDFYEALCCDEGADTAAFLTLLIDFRAAAREMTVDRLLWKIYTDSRAMAIFGAMADGGRRKENLVALFSYAGQMTGGGKGALFDFVSHLRRLLALDNPPAITTRHAALGVRIMSVHRSKGLEFPVVFLADLQRKFDWRDTNAPVLVHPALGLGTDCVNLTRRLRYSTVSKTAVQLQLMRESRSEEMRILYVALSRAKEKLILVDCRRHAARHVADLMALSSSPVEPEAVGGAGTPGDWVLLALLCARQGAPLRRWVGQQTPSEIDGEGWQVHIWENPTQEDLPAQHAAESAGAQEPGFDIAALEGRYSHEEATVLPSKVTATQLKGREKDEEIADGTVGVPALSFPKPHFLMPQRTLNAAERGTAVHLVMQYLDFSAADEAAVGEQVERLCQRRLLTPEQAAAVDCGAIAAFLRSDLAGRIRRAPKVYREYRFALLMDASLYSAAAQGEELLLQGVVDCAFETPEGLVVVDFKTDRLRPGEERARAEYYRAQLEAYAAALSRVLQRRVTERILYFFATGREISL